MKTYVCPECGANVPLGDINVAADVALCRSCGARSHVADLRENGDESRTAQVLPGEPSKHVKVIRDPNDINEKVELRFWKFQPVVLFLIPFACVWIGGAIGGIYGTQIARHSFDLKLSLFGIPFVIASLILIGVISTMLFAKRRLSLEYGKGSYSVKVFGIGFTHRFKLGRETQIVVGQADFQPRGAFPIKRVIRVKNGNVSEKACGYWDEDALEYALAMTKRYRV